MLRKVNRETAILKKEVKREKILRKCWLLKQPSAILQYVASFLSWYEVLNLQKTCEHFRRRYIERLEGGVLRIKANTTELHRSLEVESMESYLHLRSIRVTNQRMTFVKNMAKNQTHSKLEIMSDVKLDDLALKTLKPHKLILYEYTPLAEIKSMFDSLKHFGVTDYGITNNKDVNLSEEDLDVLKESQLKKFYTYAALSDISKLIHIPHLSIQFKLLDDVSAVGSATSKVRTLDISNTRVRDVSMLGNLKTLIAVGVKTFTDVSALGRLQGLNISNTNVVDVHALGNIHVLNLSHTNVVDVSALGNVHTLNISYTSVVDVSALGNVHTLDISNTKVFDVRALGRVHALDISHTKVTNVSALGHVHELNISFTKVTDVSALTHVQIINLSRTQVNDLRPLSNAREITFRAIDPNTDISALKFVHTLDISHSEIKNLRTLSKDPNMFAHIRVLDLSYTRVTDVNMLKRVHTLKLIHTAIVDVSSLTHVRVLDVSYNWQLSKIQGLKRTERLIVNHNAWVHLDIRGLKAKSIYTNQIPKDILRKHGWVLSDENIQRYCLWLRQ